MKVIIALILIFAVNSNAELHCNGPYEHIVHKTPIIEMTCDNMNKKFFMGFEDKESCQCIAGYVRDMGTGQCVTRDHCPHLEHINNKRSTLECDKPHEFLSQLTYVCPMTCQTLHKRHCKGLYIKESCVCDDGYVRDTISGNCVTVDQCPKHE